MNFSAPAAGLPILPHRSSLAAAPLRFAPAGDLARRVIVNCPFAGFVRALLCGDGGGAADHAVEVVCMLWRWIVRRARVEVRFGSAIGERGGGVIGGAPSIALGTACLY